MSLYSVSALDREAARHVSRRTCARTSEEEDVGEARSAREQAACIVAGPLLYLSQKRSRPGHTLVPPTRLTPTWKNPASCLSDDPSLLTALRMTTIEL